MVQNIYGSYDRIRDTRVSSDFSPSEVLGTRPVRIDLIVLCDLIERLSGLFIMAEKVDSESGVLHNVTMPRSWFINLIIPDMDLEKDTATFSMFAETIVGLMQRIDAQVRRIDELVRLVPRLNTLAQQLNMLVKRIGTQVQKTDALVQQANALAQQADALVQQADALIRRADALVQQIDAQDQLTDAQVQQTDAQDRPTDMQDQLTDVQDRLTDAQDQLTDTQDQLDRIETGEQFIADGSRVTSLTGPLYIART